MQGRRFPHRGGGAGLGRGSSLEAAGEGQCWGADSHPPRRGGGAGPASLPPVGEGLVWDAVPQGAGEGPEGTRVPLPRCGGLGEGRAGAAEAAPLAVLPAGVGALAAAAPP